MLIGEPQHSPYDWRFQLFGFPVRVTWLFWVVSAAMGYGNALSFKSTFELLYQVNVNFAMLLGVWVGMTFVSILLHELGHTLAFRYFGIESQIVLYQMGGLAIPGAGMIWGKMGKKRRLTHIDQIIISAAGPVIQLLLALVVGVLATLSGVFVWEFSWFASLLQIPVSTPKNPIAAAAIVFTVQSSIWWALINLLPIFPMDGGHIAKHLIGLVRRTSGEMEAYMVGAVGGILVAYWMSTHNMQFTGLFFVSLALTNIQALQANNGSRFW
jgi:stage IV sporulation protein FB